MNEHISLTAEKRKIQGKKVKQLRRQGLLPANVFGKGIKSVAVQLSLKDFLTAFKKAGETHLIELKTGDSSHNVLIHNLQLDPVSDTIVHVDFQAVSLKEKIVAMIPVKLMGESPAEKEKIGILVQQLSEVEVEALPTDLPDHFEADISGLKAVDATIFVKDLSFDPGKIVIQPEDLEKIVAKVEPPAKEEVVAPPPAAEAPGTEEAKEETPSASPQAEEQKPE